MIPHTVRFTAVLAATIASTGTARQNPDDARPEVLPRVDEMAMALSAAPAHLRDGATVYVLEQHGFVRAREGSNGFSCIVNRDHPLQRKPTCYDAEGSATILPVVLRWGELLMEGKGPREIAREIRRGFEDGTYISPRRPGVAYMLTDHIRTYNPNTGGFGTFPPHIMFYAPNLTNADIGASQAARRQNPWLPFIGYQGPQGYMIVVIGDTGATGSG